MLSRGMVQYSDHISLYLYLWLVEMVVAIMG